MIGFLFFIPSLIVILSRQIAAVLAGPHPATVFVSSAGLAWPSMTENPLMVLVMLPVTLESPVLAALELGI